MMQLIDNSSTKCDRIASNGTPFASANAESSRVIIVSHSYAPMLNPRALRWTAIAEHLAEAGKRVDVVCSWSPDMHESACNHSVNIHRVGAGLIERLRAILRTKERTSLVSSATGNNTQRDRSVLHAEKNTLKTLTRRFHDLTWKNVYWPDYAALWAKPAIERVNSLLADDDTNVTLITVSDPFTSHVVGRSVKRAHPDLNWIVDIGDPFCFRHDTPTNNHTLYRAYNYRCERKVFNEADSISVTTGATMRRYAELFPAAAEKITVIPPLVTFAHVDTQSAPLEAPLGESDAFKALFTGALYRNIRNPEYLLQLFAALQEATPDVARELHFFGPTDDCKNIFDSFNATLQRHSGLSVHLHGLMSHSTTIAGLQQADLLVNIGNANPYQLPSKVVEYACTTKPILNISCIKQDSSTEFFAGRPNTLTLNATDSVALGEHAKMLQKFLQSDSEPVLESYCEDIRARHSSEIISKEYQRLIRQQKKKVAGR